MGKRFGKTARAGAESPATGAVPMAAGEFGEPGQLLRMLVEQAPLAVIAYDLAGRVAQWNPGAERILGWSREEALGGPPPHVRPSDRAEFEANHERSLALGGFSDLTVKRTRKDGSAVWLASSNSVLRDEVGHVIGVVSMQRDVTSLHEARQQQLETEARYRSLVEKMPMAAFLAPLDLAAPLLYAGPQFSEMTGYPPEVVTGNFESFADAVLPEDRQVVLEAARRVRAEGGVVEVEYRLRAPDGRLVWLQERVVRVDAEDGTPICVQGFIVDITAQREAQEREARLTSRLQVVMDGVGEGIFRIDETGLILFSNRAFHEITGWSAEELRGRDPRSLLRYSPESGHPSAGLPFDCRQPTVAGRLEQILLRCRDDSEIPVNCTVSSLVEQEKPAGSAIVVRDVSKMVALETQLRHAQRMEAVGRLAGGIAHDFNNLLTVISGHAAMAVQRLGQDEDIEQVLRAAGRAAALTQQLLAYGRRQVLQPSATDINKVVGGMQTMLAALLGADLELVVEATPAPSFVMVDAGQLEQVLLNLALNARDAMPDGGRLTFRIGQVPAGSPALPPSLAAEDRDWVVVGVADTGVGIDPRTLELVFEPFFTTKDVGRGSGLGLSTAYGIVNQSGGDIVARSEPGIGTEFSIFLPAAAATVGATVTEPAAEPPGAATEVEGGSETVLLLEDQDAVRRLLARSLVALGYQVVEAADIGVALELAELHRLDAVVTDIVLPSGKGTDLLRTLRESVPELPAVLISGYHDLELRSGLPAGCVFLQKPFGTAEMGSALRGVLDAAASAQHV